MRSESWVIGLSRLALRVAYVEAIGVVYFDFLPSGCRWEKLESPTEMQGFKSRLQTGVKEKDAFP